MFNSILEHLKFKFAREIKKEKEVSYKGRRSLFNLLWRKVGGVLFNSKEHTFVSLIFVLKRQNPSRQLNIVVTCVPKMTIPSLHHPLFSRIPLSPYKSPSPHRYKFFEYQTLERLFSLVSYNLILYKTLFTCLNTLQGRFGDFHL